MGQLQIALLMGAIALASGFTAGWKVNGWRYEAQRAAVEESISEALTATAKELAKIEVKNVTIRQQMETKVIERTIYHECKHEPDGVRLINEALNGKSVDNSKLPGVDTTSGE
jgi:hypothetical protein